MRSAMALGLILAIATTAHAGWLNRLGRHLGIGWSDGYHAFDRCPPGACHGLAIPHGAPLPHGPLFWDKAQPTPLPPPEMLPAPPVAARRPSENATPHPAISLPR